MTDRDGDEVRDVLLAHSDHQAVRNVFGAHTGSGQASLVDYVETMRATEGAVALVASEGAGEIYARWDGRGGRYEHLTIWPPWTIGGRRSPTTRPSRTSRCSRTSHTACGRSSGRDSTSGAVESPRTARGDAETALPTGGTARGVGDGGTKERRRPQ